MILLFDLRTIRALRLDETNFQYDNKAIDYEFRTIMNLYNNFKLLAVTIYSASFKPSILLNEFAVAGPKPA
jgi:hypothetical protein